jgi:hypothetical protein
MRDQMRSTWTWACATPLLTVLCALATADAQAAEADKTVGIVSHVKVVSSAVPDVSSMEAWKKSCVKDDMTPPQKALAVWRTVAAFGLEGAPIAEFMGGGEDCVHDPIKTFNVYGCNFCCCSAGMVEALGRYLGMEARGWSLHGHCVSDLFYDNAWHLLDAAYMNYFIKPDGNLASVEEIRAAVKDWYAANPQYVGKLNTLPGGWNSGPPLLATCPLTRPDGSFPSVFGDWGKTMVNYDGAGKTPGIYEEGYHQGYEVNIHLRKGERLTRNWSNKGAALPAPDGLPAEILNCKVGEGILKFSPSLGDLANGRIGHGTHEYDVPLADGAFRGGALLAENLAARGKDKGAASAPALHLKDPGQVGELIIRMTCGYLYLTGQLAIQAVVPDGGQIAVAFSDNNGLDWSNLAKITKSGLENLDLLPKLARRYDYQVKLTLKGTGVGMDSLKFTHDILQSQRALPALREGANTITFSAAPSEGTVTITGNTDPACTKQLKIMDFHPDLAGVQPMALRVDGKGTATFRMTTPGAMTRLRFGGHYRARDKKDGWEYQVSFDDGKTFQTVAEASGPTAGNCKYVTFDKVPVSTKQALVRFAGRAVNVACLFRVRLDADYLEPQGGFRPIKVTYLWEEGGQPKQDIHTARSATEEYTIHCAGKPTMKSIIMEWAE